MDKDGHGISQVPANREGIRGFGEMHVGVFTVQSPVDIRFDLRKLFISESAIMDDLHLSEKR